MSNAFSHRSRRPDLFNGQNVTSTNVAFQRRKLAGIYGATSRTQVYKMYTDIILDSIDHEALGPNSVSSIESAIIQGKPGFLKDHESVAVYPYREAPFSVPCAIPSLFDQMLASHNMTEGPYAIDFNGLAFDGSYTGAFMDSNGARVVSSGPINSLSTTQPFLVYINPMTMHLGGQGGYHTGHPPFFSIRARELITSGIISPTSAIIKLLKSAWEGTPLESRLMEILQELRASVHDSMAVATLTVLYPELFSSTSGIISVPPTQKFDSTIGDHVLDLYAHYGSSNRRIPMPAGEASDDTVNLIIADISSGKGFLDVTQGDGVTTQLALRDPVSQTVYPNLCLSDTALRVRCASKRMPSSTYANSLILALEELSSIQRSNMLTRKMSLLKTSRLLVACSNDAEKPLSSSINAIKDTLSSLTFPVFISLMSSIDAKCSVQGIPIKSISAMVTTAQKESASSNACIAESYFSAPGLGLVHAPPRKRLRTWAPEPSITLDPPHTNNLGPVAAAMCFLATGIPTPAFEDFSLDTYVGWVCAALGDDMAQRIRDGSKFCYGHVTTGCNKPDCPFEHVSRDMIAKLVTDIVASKGVPFYVPKSVLETCVGKETMLRYFELKRLLRKKDRPLPKSPRAPEDKNDRVVRFNPLPPAILPGPSHLLSSGIPLSHNHPVTAASNCLTYDTVSQTWLSSCNSSTYCYTATPVGEQDIGNCFTTSGGVQRQSPLDTKSDGVARAIKEIFGWRDQRLEYKAVAPNDPSATSCILGDSKCLEPTAAVLKTNPDGLAILPATGLCTALADTGSGICIVSSKDFGSNGPLHDLVAFSAPLHGLGKFEVKGVGGERSAISHLCWVQIPVMVSRSDSPAVAPESVPCIIGFNAFLAEINNPHAVIIGNKTLGALGAFVLPAYATGPPHASSNQLRLQGKLPFDLALHPFLVKSAHAMLVSEGCGPDVRSSLESLLRARSLPTPA